MTQLLISVKNVQEAALVLAAGVDIIDLKEPNIGALGALDLLMTEQILAHVNGEKTVSATVGEQHANVAALVNDIQKRADIGVDIIKIAVSDLFQATDFYDEIAKLTNAGIKIVAVFFADNIINFELLPRLKQAGFYGAMLDTQHKQHDLLNLQSEQTLHLFIQACQKNQLVSGLAGSLKPQYVDLLLKINPTYIGFRGGVCENADRKSGLSQVKLSQLQNVLRNGNKNHTKAQLILSLALHS